MAMSCLDSSQGQKIRKDGHVYSTRRLRSVKARCPKECTKQPCCIEDQGRWGRGGGAPHSHTAELGSPKRLGIASPECWLIIDICLLVDKIVSL